MVAVRQLERTATISFNTHSTQNKGAKNIGLHRCASKRAYGCSKAAGRDTCPMNGCKQPSHG